MSAWMLAVTLVGAGAVLRLEGDGQTTGASKKWARPPARLARKSSPYDYWRVLFITHSSKNCNNKKKRTVDHTHAFTFASLLSLVEDSVISSRRYTHHALLANLKYVCSPCVLYSFLSCIADVDLSFFLSSLPSLFRFWFRHRLFSSCLFLLGTMLSPRFRFLLRLV